MFVRNKFIIKAFLRWPRELNVLQLQKTHANRKSTSKSRNRFHHFDSRWCKCSQHKQIKKHCKCSQHNQIHFICSAFLFLVVLWAFAPSNVCCQIDESVFLICRCFFYLQRVSFFGCVVSICSVCVVKLMWKCFLNLQVFFLFAARFFFGCVVSICSVCVVKLRKLFLNLQVFFLFAARWALSATVHFNYKP